MPVLSLSSEPTSWKYLFWAWYLNLATSVLSPLWPTLARTLTRPSLAKSDQWWYSVHFGGIKWAEYNVNMGHLEQIFQNTIPPPPPNRSRKFSNVSWIFSFNSPHEITFWDIWNFENWKFNEFFVNMRPNGSEDFKTHLILQIAAMFSPMPMKKYKNSITWKANGHWAKQS